MCKYSKINSNGMCICGATGLICSMCAINNKKLYEFICIKQKEKEEQMYKRSEKHEKL